MNSPCQAPAALGTVPTLQNTSLWLWGHHLCKIKYGLDDVFVFFFFYSEDECGVKQGLSSSWYHSAPMSSLSTSTHGQGLQTWGQRVANEFLSVQ